MSEIDKFSWDDKLTGFGLRERGGRRSWVIQYRLGHKQRRLKIGSAEKLSKAQARDVARKKLAMVELGQDPAAERQQARKEAKFTLKAVAADYLASKKAELRASTFRNLTLYLGIDPNAGVDGLRKRKRDLTGYWAALHSVPINAIDRRDVAAELGRITRKHGATSAARARTTLSAFYSWAMGEGIAEKNPVIGTNAPAEAAASNRVLGDAELAAIWKAAPANAYGRIVKLLILTGCRREEIGGLARTEIDPEKRTIHLPAARTKNGRPHDIWLSDLAWSVLEEADWVDREFIFSEGGRAFGGWSKGKRNLDERLGDAVAAWRVHDLRRTFSTRMGDLGVQPHIVETALNHYSGHRAGVAGVYNKSLYEKEVRAALMLWSDHVRSVVEGSSRKIIPMRQAEKVS